MFKSLLFTVRRQFVIGRFIDIADINSRVLIVWKLLALKKKHAVEGVQMGYVFFFSFSTNWTCAYGCLYVILGDLQVLLGS